jgi:hypothetical protein
MAVERPSSAISVISRIKMEHYPGDFAPVSSFRVRVEQTQIRDEVLFVVDDQYGIGGRGIGESGASGGFCIMRLVIRSRGSFLPLA